MFFCCFPKKKNNRYQKQHSDLSVSLVMNNENNSDLSTKSINRNSNEKAHTEKIKIVQKISFDKPEFKGSLSHIFDGAPTSLNHVLNSKTLRQMFREYLESAFACESLNFYETIESYNNVKDHTYLQQIGEGIINQYVKEESPQSVNIDSKMRQKLLSVTEFNPQTFDDAKDALYDLMRKNFFTTFVVDKFGDSYYKEQKKGSIISLDGNINTITDDDDTELPQEHEV